jgi:hypothetical protein
MFEWMNFLPTLFLAIFATFSSLPEVSYDQIIIASYLVDEQAELSVVSPDEHAYINSGHPFSGATEVHEWMWRQFVGMSDVAFVSEHVSGFDVFVDTPAQDQLAYVSQDYQDSEKWIVAMDIDDTLDNRAAFLQTLVHELAHLITLESDQVEVSHLFKYSGLDDATYYKWYEQAVNDCATYFTGEGCAHEYSYINSFVSMFWQEIIWENGAVDTNFKEGNFYSGRQSEFVSSYAASNPGEDIAESFMFFVFQDRANGDRIRDQKQNFFYGYPSLVELRDQIRTSIGEILIKSSSKAK